MSSFNTAGNEIENNAEGGTGESPMLYLGNIQELRPDTSFDPVFCLWYSFAGTINPNDLSAQNKEIHSELAKKIEKLNRLKEKVTFCFI